MSSNIGTGRLYYENVLISLGYSFFLTFCSVLQTDPEKASMPKDGTVHELTNRVIAQFSSEIYYFDQKQHVVDA